MLGGDIIEGFLCPICMKDLGTVTQLQGHFEEEHSSEDKDVLNQLKGMTFFFGVVLLIVKLLSCCKYLIIF